VALLAELNSTRDNVSIPDFANNNLDVTDRKSFIEQMGEARLPSTGFDKNIRLIRNHLRQIQMAFVSGVSILAPPESIGSKVTITEVANGETKVEVTDRLKRMKG
jgi:hypothetical protein